MKLTEDSPVVTIADQIAEIIVAGFLWLIACIPIITIGPASAALYYTIVKVVRKKHSTVTQAFWYSFKENLKQGIVITLIYLVYAVILFFYVSTILRSGMFGKSPYLFVTSGIFLASPFVFTIPYIFSVLSRFRTEIAGQFRYALHLSMSHFPITLILIVGLGVAGMICYLFPFFMAIIPGFYAWASSFLIEKALQKYMKQARKTEESVWYFE